MYYGFYMYLIICIKLLSVF